MQCQKCLFENREGVNFCEECGTKIELVCPGCETKIPTGSKFCGQCGHSLSAQSSTHDVTRPVDPIAKLKSYLPSGLSEKILTQRGRIEGEKRQVTVLFCDLVGFTPLTEKLGPEEAYNLMNRIYEILIQKVNAFEGTVNEMTGDGILGLFGTPIALEDAPQRAIRSALAIHWEMARLNEQLLKEGNIIPTLRMRIGIHTGVVVVGTLGNDLRVDFKVVGDTVNLASRMEGLAEPGTTYITGTTYKLTEGFFRFEGLGKKEIKGKKNCIEVYRVIAPNNMRTRFDVSAEQGLTPFMGRDRELELLKDVYRRVINGRGQAVSIVADAGMGKSRLLYEFRKTMTNEDVTFLEGKCLSYSKGKSYHPVIDLLKGQFDILETDEDPEILNKVKQGLKLLQINETTTLPYFLELLSVRDSSIDQNPFSPEGKKDKIIQALTRIVLNESEIKPLILLVEDLHWIDRGSEDFLKNLLNNIPGARVMLIFTYRTEFVHTWEPRSFHSQITLNRISNRESLAMVSHLLSTDSVAENLQDLILEKTEGIPFFLEEFMKSLKDLKFIRRQDTIFALTKDPSDITIPSTIQDVIMVRVDPLAEGVKEILQTGSVIEREFSFELVQKATNHSEPDLLSHLMILKDAELLYERGVYPNITYIFKHALTREVIYDSILTKRRKEIHTAVAEAMEQIYQLNIEDHLSTLCDHFMAGGDYKKGQRYAKLAARKAIKSGSIIEAVDQGIKRIACLEKLSLIDEDQKKLIDARTILGFNLAQLSHYVEAKEAIDPIIDLAEKMNYKKRLCQIKTIQGIYHANVKENFSVAFQFYEEALIIAEEVNDIVTLTIGSTWFGTSLALNCDFKKATPYMQKSLDIIASNGILYLMAPFKAALAYYCLFCPGNIDSGFQMSVEAVQLSEKGGDSFSKGLAYTTHGFSCYGKGLFEKAEEYLLKGIKFCERANEVPWNAKAHCFLAEICIEKGDFLSAEKFYKKGCQIIKNGQQFPSLDGWLNAGLIMAKSMINPNEIDLETLYTYSSNNKLKVIQGWISGYIGATLMNMDNSQMAEAQTWIQKAIEENKRNFMRFVLGKNYILYAEWFKRKNEPSKAQENLRKAIEILKECGADGWVKKYQKQLAALR